VRNANTNRSRTKMFILQNVLSRGVYAIVEAQNLEEAKRKASADLAALQSEQVMAIDPEVTAEDKISWHLC
jgi:hypothetical protein